MDIMAGLQCYYNNRSLDSSFAHLLNRMAVVLFKIDTAAGNPCKYQCCRSICTQEPDELKKELHEELAR